MVSTKKTPKIITIVLFFYLFNLMDSVVRIFSKSSYPYIMFLGQKFSYSHYLYYYLPIITLNLGVIISFWKRYRWAWKFFIILNSFYIFNLLINTISIYQSTENKMAQVLILTVLCIGASIAGILSYFVYKARKHFNK